MLCEDTCGLLCSACCEPILPHTCKLTAEKSVCRIPVRGYRDFAKKQGLECSDAHAVQMFGHGIVICGTHVRCRGSNCNKISRLHGSRTFSHWSQADYKILHAPDMNFNEYYSIGCKTFAKITQIKPVENAVIYNIHGAVYMEMADLWNDTMCVENTQHRFNARLRYENNTLVEISHCEYVEFSQGRVNLKPYICAMFKSHDTDCSLCGHMATIRY